MNRENMSESMGNKKSLKKIIIGIIVLVVAVITCIVVLFLKNQEKQPYNKYNNMGYLNVYGKTLEEYAEMKGYTLEEFKYQFSLPDDMPGDTYFDAAYAMMPIRVIAGQEMTDYKTLKEKLKVPDIIYSESGEAVEVTDKTPWGLVRDNVLLENLYTEEEFLKMKEDYGFGEEITMQSLYRVVRPKIEEAALEARLKKEEEEAAGKSEKEETEDTETTQTEETDKPAEE